MNKSYEFGKNIAACIDGINDLYDLSHTPMAAFYIINVEVKRMRESDCFAGLVNAGLDMGVHSVKKNDYNTFYVSRGSFDIQRKGGTFTKAGAEQVVNRLKELGYTARVRTIWPD